MNNTIVIEIVHFQIAPYHNKVIIMMYYIIVSDDVIIVHTFFY